MDYLSKSEKETASIASLVLQKCPDTNLFGLSGDLGSGKTAFVKGVAKELGIDKNVTSPTFVIMKIYLAKKRRLVHIDAYRLEKQEDISLIGYDEFASDPVNIIFIEWPERVFDKIPENMKIINFTYIDEKTRKITI